MIVGLGGALRPHSSTAVAIQYVLRHAAEQGAETMMFDGPSLVFGMYAPNVASDSAAVTALISAVRRADAVVIGSPGYHGTISGLVKNALDYLEETARDPRPYLSGRPVACIATGAGWQGSNATLHTLRSVVHALRGWPTPLGIALNSREPLFETNGKCVHVEVEQQLRTVAEQLLSFKMA